MAGDFGLGTGRIGFEVTGTDAAMARLAQVDQAAKKINASQSNPVETEASIQGRRWRARQNAIANEIFQRRQADIAREIAARRKAYGDDKESEPDGKKGFFESSLRQARVFHHALRGFGLGAIIFGVVGAGARLAETISDWAMYARRAHDEFDDMGKSAMQTIAGMSENTALTGEKLTQKFADIETAGKQAFEGIMTKRDKMMEELANPAGFGAVSQAFSDMTHRFFGGETNAEAVFTAAKDNANAIKGTVADIQRQIVADRIKSEKETARIAQRETMASYDKTEEERKDKMKELDELRAHSRDEQDRKDIDGAKRTWEEIFRFRAARKAGSVGLAEAAKRLDMAPINSNGHPDTVSAINALHRTIRMIKPMIGQ